MFEALILRDWYPLILADLNESGHVGRHNGVEAPMVCVFRSLTTEWIPIVGYMTA